MSEPLVSCIMVTGKNPARVPLALAACLSFIDQTYCNTELIIVNTGEPLMPKLAESHAILSPPGRIRERFYNDSLTLGDLRNIGLELANGDYIVQFDDDDWSHPSRIEQQLSAALIHNCPVTLLRQVRYSFKNDNAFVCCQLPRPGYALGLPGTVLHPQTAIRYRSERRHEDTHFLQEFVQIHILDNKPELYLRFAHAYNTWSSKHIMQRYNFGRGQRKLSRPTCEYLNHVLATYYYQH